MFKKLFLASALVALSSNIALANALYLAPGLVFTNSTSEHSRFTGFNPRLALGYSGLMSYNVSLAGEIFSSLGVINISSHKNTPNTGIKNTRDFGASILPGILFNDSITGFARIGVVDSRFSSPGTTSLGGQLGLGLQGRLNDTVDLRGEYTYTAYHAIRNIGSIKTNQLGLSLVYKFI